MRKIFYLYILILFTSATSFAVRDTRISATTVTKLDKCLNSTTSLIKDCLKQTNANQSIGQCFSVSETIYSAHSKEAVKNHCFYQVSEFPTLKTCVDSAKKFFIAENKDQGLFECFRQFSNLISENNCLRIAKMMTYSGKRSYLENHCRNL